MELNHFHRFLMIPTTLSPTDPQQIQETLVRSFGVVMSGEEVASVLKLRSAQALNAARCRGAIRLTPIRVQGRRALVYGTAEVAEILGSWLSSAPRDPPTQSL
jgi:predicted N-acetyltransferase YhbS